MIYLKLMPYNYIKGASRNLRELATAKDAGYRVIVVSEDRVAPNDIYELRYSGIRCLSQDIPKLKRIKMIICDNAKLIINLRKTEKDVVSCHNIRALLIGWISSWFAPVNSKAKLIYDSHEFEIGNSGENNKVAKWIIKHLERFLMKRCAFSIMVNDSIADKVQQIHSLKERPVVVRSTPNYWIIDKEKIRQTRHELLNSIGVSDDTFAIMYHGGIMNNRGVESVIELVSMNPNIVGIILGNGEEKYINSLHTLATEKGVKDRVVFHPAVSLDELWMYVGAADVGMVVVKRSCISYYYMLPNKFFESIQSLTPIIGSDFPEIRRIVDEYGVGLVCDPADLSAMNACVEKMRTDKEFYNKCKVNLEKAKEDLCWENEKKVLLEAYGRFLD